MGYTNFSMMQTKEQNTMNFQYGDREMEYLTAKDKRLGDAIKRIGYIEREIDPDLFPRLSIISSDSRSQLRRRLRSGPDCAVRSELFRLHR